MQECLFCHLELEPTQTIVFEGEHSLFLMLSDNPITGSGVIVPKKHRETVFDLTEAEWLDTQRVLHQAKEYLDQQYSPQGYNVGWNSGSVAGQHIFHAHLHIIPRYAGEALAGKGIRYMFKKELMIVD